jgi:hypothetical protein
MPPPRLDIVVESHLSSVATFGETVIVVVHSEVTEESLQASITACHRLHEKFPGGVVGLTVVECGIKLPDAPLRQASSAAMAATSRQTRIMARVFLGEGFWLSTVRSVLTAIELIRPYDLPRRTFTEIEPATRWLAKGIQQELAWADRLSVAAASMTRNQAQQRSHGE